MSKNLTANIIKYEEKHCIQDTASVLTLKQVYVEQLLVHQKINNKNTTGSSIFAASHKYSYC